MCASSMRCTANWRRRWGCGSKLVHLRIPQMQTEADFQPIPQRFIEARSQLRIVGYDLVRYTESHSTKEAARFRHPPKDYEYAIHKIEFIDSNDGQVFINKRAFYCSDARVSDWVKYYTEKEKPLGISLVKDWATSPVSVAITALALPYSLAMLGLTAASEYSKGKEHKARQVQLQSLSEFPKFWKPKRL